MKQRANIHSQKSENKSEILLWGFGEEELHFCENDDAADGINNSGASGTWKTPLYATFLFMLLFFKNADTSKFMRWDRFHREHIVLVRSQKVFSFSKICSMQGCQTSNYELYLRTAFSQK